MNDSNEADKAEYTLCDNIKKECHNVPYPKSGGDDTFMIGDYWNKQDNEQKNTGASSVKESASGSKNGLLGCNLNSHSNFHMKKSLGCSDFSSTSNVIELEGSFGNKHQSIPSTMVNDFKDTFCSSHERNSILTEICQSDDILDSSNPSSCKETFGFPIDGREELDSKPSVFSCEHDHDTLDNFLDCDWGSITEFDDLDKIFRNSGSIFGQEMMEDIDELFSAADSSQAEANQATPLPMHEMSINMDMPVKEGSSSFHGKQKTLNDDKETSIDMELPIEKGSSYFEENEKSQIKQKNSKDDKEMVSHDVVGKKAERQLGESKKMYKEKTVSKSQRKMEEKAGIKSHKIKSMPSYNGNVQVQQYLKYAPLPSAFQSFQPSMFPQQVKVGRPDYLGYFPSTHHPFTGYGYPAFPFPSFSLQPHVHAASNQTLHAPVYNPYVQHEASNIDSLQNQDSTKMPKMTPEEKIDKLRKRQKMQHMLAIKQQEIFFGNDVGDPDGLVSKKMLHMNQRQSSILSSTGKSEGINMVVKQHDSYSTVASDGHALQERVFREFQQTIMKLDENIRQCMKESLYRLARNAKERRSGIDRNSQNGHGVFKNETRIMQDRSSSAAEDVETDTNPIDRIMAHLLFHSPSVSSIEMVNEKMPLSTVSQNLDPKLYNTLESVSGDKQKILTK